MPATIADQVRFVPASDQSLLIYFGDCISIETHERLRKFLRLLESQPISGVRNLHPAYCSALLNFDALQITHDELRRVLVQRLAHIDNVPLPEPRHIKIPTCYGSVFGPDLSDLARLHELTPDQVIELHSSATYVVYFLGFVPGFAYLGGLPAAIATPRLATPRRITPPGSVGIADDQTGVYPFDTPGGWRIIGRTPVSMFRPDRPDMSFLAIGDRVRFTPISAEKFAAMKTA